MNLRSPAACAGLPMACVAGFALASCDKAPVPSNGQAVNFSILSAEDQQSMSRVWQPLIDDMSKATGLTIKPFYSPPTTPP
jgi:phosphonate transport system substrate-binding protein